MHSLIRNSLLAITLTLSAASSFAHEIWLERDGDGLVRVYLGEPGEPDAGDKINALNAVEVFTLNRENIAPLTQKNDHWEAAVNVPGDVRLFSDQVWQPWVYNGPAWWEFWKSGPEQLQGAILEARAGRIETEAKLNLEFVPKTTKSNAFTLMFKGTALANHDITMLTPDGAEQHLSSDAQGAIELLPNQTGRILLSAVHSIDVDAIHSGKQVVNLMYITSLTFVVKP